MDSYVYIFYIASAGFLYYKVFILIERKIKESTRGSFSGKLIDNFFTRIILKILVTIFLTALFFGYLFFMTYCFDEAIRVGCQNLS